MFSKSVFALFAAGLAAVASAYHAPVGDPSGNPITKPGLNEIVPVGKPYTITWTPTTTGTITLLLLRGPSNNVVPIATIATGIENTGTYQWTPADTLEPDTTHYGIQLIVDATGQYQYTTQFGISNPSYKPVSSSSVSGYGATSAGSTATPTSGANSTSLATYHPTVITSSHYVASTGSPVNSSSVVLPTKSMSIPSSLLTSATSAGGASSVAASASARATSTGAAGHIQAGLGLVGAVAGLVMVL